MGHSYYACDVEERTCFELGKTVPDGFDELCELVNTNQINFKQFRELGKDRLGICDVKDVRHLYSYLKLIYCENFRFVYHEDILSEDVFDIPGTKKPVYQINSLYTNSTTFTFGSLYEKK